MPSANGAQSNMNQQQHQQQQQQQHQQHYYSSSAFPPSPHMSLTSNMAEPISPSVLGGGKVVALSQQEDSGLGSLTGYPSLDGRGFSSFDSCNSVDPAQQPRLPNEHSSQDETSLSSEMLRLRLSPQAGQGSVSSCNDSRPPVEDRLSGLDGVKGVQVEEQCDSLLSSIDSGLNRIPIHPTHTHDSSSDDSPLLITDSKCYPEHTHTNTHSEPMWSSLPQELPQISAETRVALYQGDADGDNWLHLSIINHREDLARLLIRLAPHYSWLSFSNLLRQTPLHLAVLTEQAKLVRRLVCAGARVGEWDIRGDTPLHIACRLGNPDVVRALLSPVRYEETLENSWEIPYQLLPQDLSVLNGDGLNPLHVASLSGNVRVTGLLLEAGAELNAGDAKSGRTALHHAAERGRVGVLEVLVSKAGIDLARLNYAGLTAAQLAFGRKLEPIAHFLQPADDFSDGESVGEISDSEMTIVDSDSDSSGDME